jgi:three-Cys-motif partner protein
VITPERCVTCGELLERDQPVCRACGEDHDPRAEPTAPDAQQEEDDYIVHPDLDQLGDWSTIKHEIIENYGREYTTILSKQAFLKRLLYIDGFAGSGIAQDRETREIVAGSAYRMLMDVQPPFHEYHFIDNDPQKLDMLRNLVGDDPRVQCHLGDANRVLMNEVLPRCRYEDYARGLCLLDPYGLTVDWDVLKTIGKMGSVEIFFNFMVVGANRNVLWKDPSRVSAKRRALMTRVWGDESWLSDLYRPVTNLFGTTQQKIAGNDALIRAYQQRLKNVAGFKYVPDPIPMKNTRNATVYYLFFATQNETADRIVRHLFEKYQEP